MTHIDDGDDSDQVKRPSPDAPQLTAQEARQARWGKPVLWILIISTALVVIGFAAAHFGVFA
jgi:hypothetical protein